MGLDLIEFAFAVENAFGLYLPEPEVVELVTPGLLVDYLVQRLPPAHTRQYLDQVAFYRIRRGVVLAPGYAEGCDPAGDAMGVADRSPCTS